MSPDETSSPQRKGIIISTAVAVPQSDLDLLLAQQEEEEVGEVSYRVPILKVTQSMTKEVKAGDVEAGQFYNTLTDESYGDEVEFVVGFFQRGRSASHKDGRYRNTISQDLIPDDQFWKDLLGEEWVGTRFDEHPDAEEMFKERVNSNQIEWGKGPLISTTYNYTGLVIPASIEGGEAEDPMPARISFLRSTKDAHDKIQTLKRATMRRAAFWDVAFVFSTQAKTFGRNESYVVQVKKGRETTDSEKLLAVEVAQAAAAGRIGTDEQAAANGSAAVAPDSKGGLEV